MSTGTFEFPLDRGGDAITSPVRSSTVFMGSPSRAARLSASIWPNVPLEDRVRFEATIDRFGVPRDASGRPTKAKDPSDQRTNRMARDPLSGRRVSDIDAFARRRYGLDRKDLMAMFGMTDLELPSRSITPKEALPQTANRAPAPVAMAPPRVARVGRVPRLAGRP